MINDAILNLRYLCNPEAFLSDLRFNKSMNTQAEDRVSKNFLSFDSAKLDKKKPSFLEFVSS